MASRNEELLKRLLVTFRVEADEHLKAMAAGLLSLEQAPGADAAAGVLETVFREAHSLKGAARAVGHAPVESLCQSLEGVFSAMQQGRLSLTPPLFGLLHRALAMLESLLGAPPSAAPSPELPVLVAELEAAVWGLSGLSLGAVAGSAPAPEPVETVEEAARMPARAQPAAVAVADSVSDTVRIATRRLDAVMRQAEELLGPRLAARQRVEELGALADLVRAQRKRRVQLQAAWRRVDAASSTDAAALGRDLKALMQYVEDEALFVARLAGELARQQESAARAQRQLDGCALALLDGVKQMQLRPVTTLFESLPRLARDLAGAQGKSVALSLRGGEVELDRRILDALKDPMIHLLRNAIDHGIEASEARVAAGKPRQGVVTVSVAQIEGGKVELSLSDDGGGIDLERVVAVARRKGLLSEEEAGQMAPGDAAALVLRSGLSTSPIITDVSGRGLGLAIVREKVEGLGGQLAIDTRAGAGTRFRMLLPLTLATLRGVLVRLGERLCAVPASGIERVAQVAEAELSTVENRATVLIEGRVLPLVDLAELLALPRPVRREAAESWPVLVLGQDAGRVAFRVDALVGEQEILLKPLGPQLVRVRHVAGASVLGSGELVPVLHVADLLEGVAGAPSTAVGGAAAPPLARSVLVAEDSVTSRALLKSILESVGYQVSTAVDGLEALSALKTGDFDLLVSDVEMPRMDGFDLTARIRSDPRLAELPVVLVTALDSREDRERGVDAGASAYIVKSRFDQGNLLETIERLL